MARVAIFAILPVVAILLWRDVVLERQIAALVATESLYDVQARALVAARDGVVDDATWDLVDGAPDRALARIQQAAAMPAPRGMPERAWLVGAAAACTLRTPDYAGWRRDPRVARYCERAGGPR